MLEKSFYLWRRRPLVLIVLCKNEDVVPNSLDNHFRVMNQLCKELILDFAIKLVFQHFDEVYHSLYQFHQLLILENFIFVFHQFLRNCLYWLNFFIDIDILIFHKFFQVELIDKVKLFDLLLARKDQLTYNMVCVFSIMQFLMFSVFL